MRGRFRVRRDSAEKVEREARGRISRLNQGVSTDEVLPQDRGGVPRWRLLPSAPLLRQLLAATQSLSSDVTVLSFSPTRCSEPSTEEVRHFI